MNWIIGRESERDAVLALFEENDVVTIVGPPGVGKTALSAFVAEQFETVYRYSPTTLPDTIPEPDPDLIIINNAETADIQSAVLMLRETNRVLIDSRTPIGVPREAIIRLNELSESDAISLFEQSASRIGFEPSRIEVRDFVNAVDCNPLAIEVGVHKLSVFPLQKITASAAEPKFLAGPNESRFESVTESFRHSLDLISHEERVCLNAMIVLEAPIGIEAATRIGETLVGGKTVDVIHNLLDHGLIERAGSSTVVAKLLARSAGPTLGTESFLEYVQEVSDAVDRVVTPCLPSIRLGDPDMMDLLESLAGVLDTLVHRENYVATDTVMEAYLWIAEFPDFDPELLQKLESVTHSGHVMLALASLLQKYHNIPDARRCLENATNPEDGILRVELMYLEGRSGKVIPEFDSDDPIVLARMKVAQLVAPLVTSDDESATAKCYREALGAVIATGDRRWQLRAQILFAVFSATQNAFTDAAIGYRKAIGLSQVVRSRTTESVAKGNLIRLNVRRGKYAEVFDDWLEYRKMKREIFGHLDAIDHHTMTMAYLETGRFESAEASSHEAVELIESSTGEMSFYRDVMLFAHSSIRFCRTGRWNKQELHSETHQGLQDVTIAFESDVEPSYERLSSDDPVWILRDLYQSSADPLERIAMLKRAYASDCSINCLGICALSNLDPFFQRLGGIEYTLRSNQFRAGFGVLLRNGRAIRTPTEEWKLIDPEAMIVSFFRTLSASNIAIEDPQLIELLWPGDKSTASALTARLKVLVSQARKLGFAVERTQGGYQLVTRLILFAETTWDWSESSQTAR